MYRQARNVCFTCYLSDRTMAVWVVFLTVYRLDVFSIVLWPLSTLLARRSTQPNLSIFSSKWLKPPQDHFLLKNSLRNSFAVYCFSSWSTLIKWKTATTTQHHKLLHHHKLRTTQVWWLNLTIKLATVSVIHVQKIVKIKITIQKLWWKSYWPPFLCGNSVYFLMTVQCKALSLWQWLMVTAPPSKYVW